MLAVDLLLVLVTSINRHLPALPGVPLFDSEGGWLVLEPFNLVRENNLAAWWSATALAVAGLLAWDRASSDTPPARWPWRVLAAAFLGLSADEACSLHERVDLPGGWISGAVLGALAVGFTLLTLRRHERSNRAARRMLSGLACFALVAVLEFLERRLALPSALHGLRAGTEEGLELLGQALLLAGLLSLSPGSGAAALGFRAARRTLVPRPARLSGLRGVLAALLLLHGAAVLFWVPGLTDLSARGDPSGWVPSLLFLLAACHGAWGAMTTGRPGWLTVFALLGASIEAVGRPGRHLASLTTALPERALSGSASLLSAFLLLLAALAALRAARRSVAVPLLLFLSGALLASAALAFNGPQQGLAAAAASALALLAVASRPG